MKEPINTTDGCAFALKANYEKNAYLNGLTRGGILPGNRSHRILPIYQRGSVDISPTIQADYYKMGYVNITKYINGHSALGIIEIYESINM